MTSQRREVGEPVRFLVARWFSPLVLFCSLLNAQSAQNPLSSAQNGSTTVQSPSAADCTDPLSLACSSQMQPNGSFLPGYLQPANPSAFSTRPMSSSVYSDSEQYAQPGRAQQARQPTPPEPLTEFQKFVASSTGIVLPIFGADLFQRVPSTFAPIDMAPVPPDYVVGPGDELRIRVWGQINIQANLRVDRSGEIYLPQVGNVHIAGLNFSELDTHLRAAVGRVYRNFDLTVDMGQIRSIQVYVSGEARQPGVYTVSSLSTLVDALFASGGPAAEGSMRAIELRRNGAVVTRIDLYDLLIKGDKTTDAKLLPGDVIYIPPVGAEAAVVGSVRNPGIYELLPGQSLGDLVNEARGITAIAADARVSIERIDEHHDRRAMEVAYDAPGMKTILMEGDVVRVYSIVPKYAKTVTLRGNLANPGRFAWHDGMRLSELIPDKESLLTRNYWWNRAQMGLPAPEFQAAPDLSSLRQPQDNQPAILPSEHPANGSVNQVESEQDPYSEEQAQNTLSTKQTAQNSSLSGTQNLLPSRSQGASEPVVVRVPAPEIDWDYAVIERINHTTLKTDLISFDLGKLVLQHDASQDLVLEPNDVVTVFSEADIPMPVAEQTKLVLLQGEFVHAGFYSVRPGETLRQLVERAGGLTQDAYLYGSEFTRQSTRVIQQARIDEYVRNLEMNMQRSTVQLAASAGAASQAQAGFSAAQASEQNFLSQLRQVRATGRIVLNFHPDSHNLDSVPDIALEDGDRFIVPHPPTAVNVVGAVYNQNSFLYKPGARTETYLRLAGGPDRDANYKRAFVIRADGEVVSRDMTKGPWGNEFKELRIYPGDTIVVPEKTFKPSALYGAMYWSQMFSQFALGAASLSIVAP